MIEVTATNPMTVCRQEAAWLRRGHATEQAVKRKEGKDRDMHYATRQDAFLGLLCMRRQRGQP